MGVLGMGSGLFEGFLAKRQTRIGDVPLGTGKSIKTCHNYIDTKNLTPAKAREKMETLLQQGAKVIVASRAFGVDATKDEKLIQEIGVELGIPISAGHEITKLYGLTIRTRSAVVNASILPRMFETATSTENSVRQMGIKAPLMIMRGDGGVMDIAEMKKRPVLTMLSGPAASVIGALMYLRASNGIYFEVGGTSTNIGVIKNGRPTVNYSVIGGGASSLLPFAAKRLDMTFRIPEQAEVISSIGVALAMVRDVVERTIPNPTLEDIKAIRKEAKHAAICSGAVPDTVEIFVEINSQTQQVRAIALGSTEVKTTDLLKECSLEESQSLAASSMSVPDEQVELAAENDCGLRVFTAIKTASDQDKRPLQVVDKKGFIKVQISRGIIKECLVADIGAVIDKVWEVASSYKSDMILYPDIFVCIGTRVLEYTGMPSKEHILKVIATEVDDFAADELAIVVGAPNDL